MASDAELGWMAGMFDGEGSVNFSLKKHTKKDRSKTPGRWTIRVRIANTYLPALIKIQVLTGLGWVRKFPKRYPQQTKPVWEWAVEAKSAEQFLAMIQPYCVIKLAQVDVALAAANLRRTAPRIPGSCGGATKIAPETHERLLKYSKEIKMLNHLPYGDPIGEHSCLDARGQLVNREVN